MVALEDISKAKGQYGVGLSSRAWNPGDPRYVRITDIDDSGRLSSTKVAPAGVESDWDGALLQPGDLLFARSGATVGKTYVHSAEHDPAVYAGYLIRFEIDPEQALPEYVFRFTQSVDYWGWVAGNQRAVAQPNINAKQYGALQVPLPPLPEQRRIAAILDHVDGLRAKRREAISDLDELTNSIFDHIFGDAAARAGKWPSSSLRSAGVSFSSGLSVAASGVREHPKNRVIKVSAVSSGEFRPSEAKALPENYDPPSSHKLHTGDLLMTRASGSVDLIGIVAKAVAVPNDLYLPDKIWRINLNGEIQSAYMMSLIRQARFREFIRHASSGASGVRNISQSKVLNFTSPVPPTALQDRFTRIINQIEATATQHRTALSELDALFASLQSRAFRGEL